MNIYSSFFISFFLIVSPLVGQTNNCNGMQEFAHSLYTEGEYYRAITEYNRILFYCPQSWDSIFIKIPDTYFKGGDYDEAINKYYQYLMKSDNMNLRSYCLFQIGSSYLLKNEYDNAEKRFLKLSHSNVNSYSEKALYYLSIVEAKKFNWNESRMWLTQLSKKKNSVYTTQKLTVQLENAKNISQKSPIIAGTLSAVVPGLGYCYVGSYRIGVASFLLNSLFLYGSYEAFKKKTYVVGSSFLVIGLGWYTGNIFGSVTKAHRYNRDKKQNFFNHLKFIY